MLEEAGGTDGAREPGVFAKHHRNKLPPVARRAGNDIISRSADKAGLHAIRPIIALQKPIMSGDHAVADLHLGHGEDVRILREFLEDHARKDGHVARRRHRLLRRLDISGRTWEGHSD